MLQLGVTGSDADASPSVLTQAAAGTTIIGGRGEIYEYYEEAAAPDPVKWWGSTGNTACTEVNVSCGFSPTS